MNMRLSILVPTVKGEDQLLERSKRTHLPFLLLEFCIRGIVVKDRVSYSIFIQIHKQIESAYLMTHKRL